MPWPREVSKCALTIQLRHCLCFLISCRAGTGKTTMQCFFSGEMFVHAEQPITAGVLSFRIPDLDITFRSQFKGSAHECQYASLLALLEFVELNPHLFKNKTLELYSDSDRETLVLHRHERRVRRCIARSMPIRLIRFPAGEHQQYACTAS